MFRKNKITDEEFIRRLRIVEPEGKRKKYETEFFVAYQYMVEKKRRKYRLNQNDALSIYIDVFQIIVAKIRKNESIDKLKAYFNRVFSNKCIDFLKKNKTTTIELPLHFDETVQEQLSNDGIYDRKDIELVKNMLHQLSSNCQKILNYLFLRGWDNEEIAEEMGYSNPRSINERRKKCLVKLRTLFKTSRK